MNAAKLMMATLAIVFVVSVAKLVCLVLYGSPGGLMAWLVFSAFVIWICWAYVKNQDLPSRGGMNYDSGQNQFGRTGYLVVMLGLFVFTSAVLK